MIPFPNKKYNIIYADPPWSYKEDWGNGAVHHHYILFLLDQGRPWERHAPAQQ